MIDQVTIPDNVRALFVAQPPNPVRLWAMLDGRMPGRLVVDEPENPTWALLQEPAEGTVYMGGAVSAPALAAAVEELRRERDVIICAWPDEKIASRLPTDWGYQGVAVDFTNRSASVDVKRLVVVPVGYQLRRIDAALAPRVDGFDYHVRMFGGLEAALAQTVGFCLVDGEMVVADAVAGPCARGHAEIGVGTREGYRRRGLATTVAARVIQEVEAGGHNALWNAAQQNAGSIALARRLGFAAEAAFDVFAWSCSARVRDGTP